MDGTYDQTAPLQRIVKFGYSRYFSFDLSAATDRLPIALQTVLLYPLIGYYKAEAWRALLVDRFYLLKKVNVKKGIGIFRLMKYQVGQPMGALSS